VSHSLNFFLCNLQLNLRRYADSGVNYAEKSFMELVTDLDGKVNWLKLTQIVPFRSLTEQIVMPRG
jgi:hypothetical protein